MPVAVIRYQHDNHLGSASLELDATAQIISYEEYHPFGTTSYRSGKSETEVSLKRYKYVGKERDEETGLYYYGFRYYAPWIARFINVDPLQHEYPHYTPFQYAGNKPITYVDLDGLEEGKKDEKPKIQTYFIDSFTGKFLGQLEGFDESNDNIPITDPDNNINIRAIDPGNWKSYQGTSGYQKIGEDTFDIKLDSFIVNIDTKKIIKDINTITTPIPLTTNTGREDIEQSLFLVYDDFSKTITSKLLPTKGNRYNLANHEGSAMRGLHTIYIDGSTIYPVIAEIHTHEDIPLKAIQPSGETRVVAPSSSEGELINGPGMSDADMQFVNRKNIPSFAIAMFKSKSYKGNIYSIVPGQHYSETKENVSTLEAIRINPLNFIHHAIQKNR